MNGVARAPEKEIDLRARGVRRKVLFVRVSEEEDALITASAAETNLTVVDFIREAIRQAVLELQGQKPRRPRKA